MVLALTGAALQADETYAPRAMEAVVVADAGRLVVMFDAGAEQMFGCPRAEAAGQPLSRFVPERVLSARAAHGSDARNGWFDAFTLAREDGSNALIEVAIFHVSWGADEVFTLILRDITGRSAVEAQLRRLNNLYSALSQINHAIAASTGRHELLEEVCRCLVELGGFQMAWIGWRTPDTDMLVPVAAWGDESNYLANIKIYVDGRPEGQGPSGTAFRTGTPMIADDMLTDPRCVPWRAEAKKRGFRSCAAFPIRLRGDVCGTLNVYAGETAFFKDKEVMLLAETARDVSYALDNYALEEERANAEAAARRERVFFNAMIESTPGILYLYNEQGRFLRWNRQFERVSGHTAEAIAEMRPADFIAPQHREELEAKIGEVFSSGSSSLRPRF